MTREEANKLIMQACERTWNEKTCKEIFKALSQEPCKDAISREELLKAIDTWDKFGYTETGCFVREPKGDYVPYIHYDDAIKCIKGMPSVTQKSGKWIYRREDKYSCSKCGTTTSVDEAGIDEKPMYKFCPYCGARMVEPQESEDKE